MALRTTHSPTHAHKRALAHALTCVRYCEPSPMYNNPPIWPSMYPVCAPCCENTPRVTSSNAFGVEGTTVYRTRILKLLLPGQVGDQLFKTRSFKM